MLSELLTSWTIRVALVLYVASLLGQLSRRDPAGGARRCWIVGSWFFLAHVIAAFAGKHRWSHAHAFADTARQTHDLIGWEFGYGIYFSYLFAAIWLADATWWWLEPARYARRPAAVSAVVHGYLFFIAFNGAIVFKAGVTRWAGIAACLLLAAAFVLRLRQPGRLDPAAEEAG